MPLYSDEDLVKVPEACRIIGGRETPIHRSTLWRGVEARRYPPPIRVGAKSVRFSRRELYDCLTQIAAARTGRAA
jgi:predicted DNA-binding transcriptional regulator AlpA